MSKAQPTPAGGRDRHGGPRRILHADDNRRQTELTARKLVRAGEEFEVDTVNSIEGAIERLRGGRYDCLITDYDFGDRDASALLSAPEVADRDLPVVLFSGSLDRASDLLPRVEEFVAKGADDTYERLADLVRSAAGDASGPAKPLAAD